jgi:hypothetical protein
MNIEIGKRYFINGESVEVLVCNTDKEVLMVKETDGNLMFVVGSFNVKDDNITNNNRLSYTVTETEMLDCINSYLADGDMDSAVTVDAVVKAVRNKYYQIPTYLAEVVAEWYMR